MKFVSLCNFCVTLGSVIESGDDELRRTKLQLTAESSGTYANEVRGHVISELNSYASTSDNADDYYAETVEEVTKDSEASEASCALKTSGSCRMWSCHPSRDAICLYRRCICARGKCAVNGGEKCMAPPCANHDAVTGNWGGKGTYYKATITSLNAGGTITVDWADGDQTSRTMAANQFRKGTVTCQAGWHLTVDVADPGGGFKPTGIFRAI